MATTQIVDNFTVGFIDTPETAFIAEGKSVVVEAFTAVNNSSIDASYKAYIKTPAGVLQPIRPFKIVTWGEDDLGTGIVNQIIPLGAQLMVESSAINSIYFTVTGREVS